MHLEVKGNIQWMIWDAWSSSQLDDFGCLGSKRLNMLKINQGKKIGVGVDLALTYDAQIIVLQTLETSILAKSNHLLHVFTLG